MGFGEEFNKRVRGRTDLDLARLLNVSLPTIDRYRCGRSAPHPLMQPTMIKAMDRNFIKLTLRKG